MDKEEMREVCDAPKSGSVTNGDAPRRQKNCAPQPEPSVSNRVRIVIPSNQEDDTPVKVSYDGRAILIPRGKEVAIPREHFEVLKDAVMTQLTGYMDDGAPIFKDIPRFAFTVIG